MMYKRILTGETTEKDAKAFRGLQIVLWFCSVVTVVAIARMIFGF